jgi:hypothetical protein
MLVKSDFRAAAMKRVYRGFAYDFQWDPAKAQTNAEKDGVNFERAGNLPRG